MTKSIKDKIVEKEKDIAKKISPDKAKGQAKQKIAKAVAKHEAKKHKP